ncbi:MAG: YdcF family protein [Bacteroidota bacterium]
MRPTKGEKVLIKIFKIGLLWMAIHWLVIILDGTLSKPQKSDAIVILATKVEEDGKLSPFLESRVMKGLELYKAGMADHIICSGGTGSEGYDEASCMKAFLIRKGVPDSCIISDNIGINTKATAHNVKVIAEQSHYKSFIIVSQYFHLSRCKLAFKKKGLTKYSTASAAYIGWQDPYSLFREFFAYYSYWLFY